MLKKAYICIHNLNKHNMKTITEIRIDALRVINNIITLTANVENGCYSDKAELATQMPRLEKIKVWAKENDQMQEIKHYFATKNFGQNNQFSATKISNFFN